MSGRSRSLATRVFFEAQFLGMEEVPHRPIIDLKATLGELGDEPAYGEVFPSYPLQKPVAVRAGDRLRLVAAHLARRNTPGLTVASNPSNHRMDAHPKLGGSSAPRHPALLNGRNCPLTKINGIRSTQRMLASTPASILNQTSPDS